MDCFSENHKEIMIMKKFYRALQNEANKTTHGYKDGLKITVTWTLRGGFTDSYAAWNQRKNTIQGQRYIRGEFHKTTRVKGWY